MRQLMDAHNMEENVFNFMRGASLFDSDPPSR